jgi:hypothetical protein
MRFQCSALSCTFVDGNFEYVYPGAVAKSSTTIGPPAGMETVAHDLAARARHLESLACMACGILEISSIKILQHSVLSSEMPQILITILFQVSNFVLIFISHQHKREKRFGSRQ